jgi:hypothetical protein
MVLYYLLWNYRSRGDATAAGAEANAKAPKSVGKYCEGFPMKTDMMPGATGTQNGNTGDISLLNRI